MTHSTLWNDYLPVPYDSFHAVASSPTLPYSLDRISPDYAFMRVGPDAQKAINRDLLENNIISSIPWNGQPGGVLTATPPVVVSENFWNNLVSAAQEAYQICQKRFFSTRSAIEERISQRTSTFPFETGRREKIVSPALIGSFVSNQALWFNQPFAYDWLASSDPEKPFQVLEFQASMAYLTLFMDMLTTYQRVLQRDTSEITDWWLTEAYDSLLRIREVLASNAPIYVMDTNAFDLTGPDKIGHAQALSDTRPITPYNFALQKMNLHFRDGAWYCDVYDPDNTSVGEVKVNYLWNRMQQDDVDRLVANMLQCGCTQGDLMYVYRFLCAQSPDWDDLDNLNVVVGPHTCLLVTKEDLWIMREWERTKHHYVRQFWTTVVDNMTASALCFYLKPNNSKSGHGVEPITVGPYSSYRVPPNCGIQQAIPTLQTREGFGKSQLPVDLEFRLMSPWGIGTQPFTWLTRRGNKKTNVGQTAVKIAALVQSHFPLLVTFMANEVHQRFPQMSAKDRDDAAFALVWQMVAPYYGWWNILVAKNT